MSKKRHIKGLETQLREYAADSGISFHKYSEYHMRLMDSFTVCDIWTTGKYYVLSTNYADMSEIPFTERNGETGSISLDSVDDFLAKLFYPVDYL